MAITNLRQFLRLLQESGEIVEIDYEVDPYLELAEIHRRVAAANGPALFFSKVKGSSFPVATNLFGSRKRIDLAFQHRPDKIVSELVHLATKDFPPKLPLLWKKRNLLKNLLNIGTKNLKKAPVKQHRLSPPDLEKLPLITSWPMDGGPFITLPLVYTEPPQGGAPNLGMYRIQRYDKNTTGLHFQIQKGGGFHYHMAEEMNQELPVHIYLGGPPALILSAITPLPENVPELLIASLLQGKKLAVSKTPYNNYPLIAECEFALVGKARPHLRKEEGPFGDHYGYYSWKHPFPIFECEAIYHKKDAVYPATVVGKPRQEDFYIGDYLQELLSPLFPVVMPGVKDLWSYGETGFHSLSAAVIKERYYRESMATAFRILGEGQLSLTKFLLLTDQPVNLRNFKETLPVVLERFKPQTDLYVFSNLSLDTLDYTGPELNKGSRGIMLGVGEKVRDLPLKWEGDAPRGAKKAASFCPGCLVVEAEDPQSIFQDPAVQKWPLVILVDDLKSTLKSEASFLWTVFTRFEPGADIYTQKSSVYRHHIVYEGPILIDARMKVSYPPVVACDETTAQKVTENWTRYFPNGMEMGDSEAAHI